jgi:hypothetical protein
MDVLEMHTKSYFIYLFNATVSSWYYNTVSNNGTRTE